MASVKATHLPLTKTNPTAKTAISGVGSGGLMTAYRKGEFVFKKKNAIFHKREDPKDPSVLPLPS